MKAKLVEIQERRAREAAAQAEMERSNVAPLGQIYSAHSVDAISNAGPSDHLKSLLVGNDKRVAAHIQARDPQEVAKREECERLNTILEVVGGVIKAHVTGYRSTDDAVIRAAVLEKFEILRRELRKSIVRDVYGNVVTDGRLQEAGNFLRSMKLNLASTRFVAASHIVLRQVEAIEQERRKSPFNPYDYPRDGHQFEAWLASSLQKFGWTAQVTPGSGDQGVDLIAKKHDLTIAIQAKCYEGKVGNAAVQEIFAGAAHFGIRHAAVITTSGFTASAFELALSTGVHLLHVADIPRLEQIFREQI